MRRTLLFIAVIIVILGAGALVYFKFFAQHASIVVSQNQNPSLPSSASNPSTPVQTTTATTTPVASPVAPRLVEISKGPVAHGEIAIDTPVLNASSSPDIMVDYIEQQSGNVYAYSHNANNLTRTSIKTIPGIRDTYWYTDGSSAIVQYLSGTDLSTVNSYVLPANSTASSSGAFFLDQNLSGIAVSSTTILTLASGVNGSVGDIEKLDGTGSTQVFSTPLSMVRTAFAGPNRYLVFTKPSSTLPGYAYLVDSEGNFTRIAGPLNGLVALPSPSGKWVLVSYSTSGVMSTVLVNTQNMQQTSLPIATIADKCVWTTDESAVYCGVPDNPPTNYAYPDDWYQGAISFSDDIWKINVTGRYAELVLDFTKQTGTSLDAENLAVDPNDSLLVFRNKNDGSLWAYEL